MGQHYVLTDVESKGSKLITTLPSSSAVINSQHVHCIILLITNQYGVFHKGRNVLTPRHRLRVGLVTDWCHGVERGVMSMSCLYSACRHVKSLLHMLNVPFTPRSPSYLGFKPKSHQLAAQSHMSITPPPLSLIIKPSTTQKRGLIM